MLYPKNIVLLICLFCQITIASVNAQFIVVSDSLLAKALCQKYPSDMSPDCLSLDTITAAARMGTLKLQNYGFSDVKELKHYKSIAFLQLTNNKIDELPDLTGWTNLMGMDVRGNPWTKFDQLTPVKNQLTKLEFRRIPPGNKVKDFSFLNTIPNLTHIQFSNYDAEILPDFSLFTGLTKVIINNNRLSFEDLKPLLNIPNYDTVLEVSPQNNLTDDSIINIYCGEDLNLFVPIDNGISGVNYSFYMDGNKIDSSSSSLLKVKEVRPADSGNYYSLLQSTDSFFDTIPLRTGNYKVVVNLSEKCPDAFSPNGDGVADELFIDGTGKVVIRNKIGEKLRELDLPGYWDGNDQSGKPVPIGIYSISFPNRGTMRVTLLR